MEVMLMGPAAVEEDRRADQRGGHEEGGDNQKVHSMIASDRSSMESSPRPSSSNPKGTPTISQEDQLESTKAEMSEVREENERLKVILSRIVKDYQSLEMQFFDIIQQEQVRKPVETPLIAHDTEEPELISLSLGTATSVNGQKKELEKIINPSKSSEKGLTLGLDCKYDGSNCSPNERPLDTSPDNSFEEPKEDESGESLPQWKMLKNSRSCDDEALQQTHAKKARVSVRARCEAPTMNDGCQWRKYGQKIAKGNPCPRAYYRCTVAPSCPVRKQVQRCQEDMSILITTYEGTHNHPLPISATAMASTTSAAACMLMSGSSTSSRPAIGSPASSTTAATIAAANANLGLNFGLSDNSRARQFYLPHPTLSSSPSHHTITLDLTAPSSSSTQHPQFNRFSSAPRYSSATSLTFSPSESNTTVPTSWGNGYLSYGAQPHNKAHIGSSTLGRQSHQDPFYQSYLQRAMSPVPATQQSLTDTIAKVITSDPSFQSVLASAITSYVGARGAEGAGGDGSGHGLKWGEHFSSAAPASNGCASSFLTRSTSSGLNPQQGSLLFLQPPLGLSTSKGASASPVDGRDNMN